MTTHVIMVVDKSGSMYHLTSDIIGGFNQYIDELKAQSDIEFRFTVTLFDTTYTSLCVNTPIAEVPKLTRENYKASGNTALIDAVGKSIRDFDVATPELADNDKVLLVVQTDGYENSSTEYKNTDIEKMISEREATGKWGFVFLGAGPDVWDHAHRMGFNTVSSTTQSGSATRTRYGKMSGATIAMASSGAPVAESSIDWMEQVVEDDPDGK